jgi:hypothetical protein
MKPCVPWESFEQVPYISKPDDFIEQHKELMNYPPAYSNISSWTRARFNPDNADFIINSKTKMFRPWKAERPEYGDITCHPVRLNDVYILRDLFITHFCTGASTVGYLRSDPKNMKNFSDSFPLFGSDDVQIFFHWHNDLVQHCLLYGVYVPPAHTLRHDECLGTWFDDLPHCVKIDVEKHFSKVLTACLRKNMQSSVCQDHPSIANIIQHCYNDGYMILYLLAQKAGKHPLLIRFPSEPHEPTQTADMTVEQYRIAWTQYLQYRLLDGTIYNDRYFLQQFVRGLHSSIKQRIGTQITHAVDKVPIKRALPKTFSPDQLTNLVEDFIEYAKLPTLLLHKTPRNYQLQSQAVNAVYNEKQECSNTPEECDNNIDLPAIIAALNNTSTSQCYLCLADDHRMAQCSIYQRLRDNPRAITSLLRQLRPQKATHRGHRSGPPREIRQLTTSEITETGEGNSPDNEAGEGLHEHTSDDNAAVTPAPDTLKADFL